ncbi:hypothetical protein V5O48_019717, partial [Marasmius crinis-equi]
MSSSCRPRTGSSNARTPAYTNDVICRVWVRRTDFQGPGSESRCKGGGLGEVDEGFVDG